MNRSMQIKKINFHKYQMLSIKSLQLEVLRKRTDLSTFNILHEKKNIASLLHHLNV